MTEDRVVVLFGGDGNEHRVSVASAQNVASQLAEATLWYWTREGPVLEVDSGTLLGFERPFENDFKPTAEREWAGISQALRDDAADGAVFFLALHGGSGEDGTIQAELESLGHAFTGSGSAASRLAFDKVRARDVVAAEGVRVADACIVDADTATHERLGAFFETHGQLVVKPIADGSSHGVRIVENESELDAAIVAIRRSGGATHLAEAFVVGRELTVGVVEHGEAGELVALPCSEVKLEPGRSFDYEGKYLGKGTVELTPAPVSDEIAAAAQQVAMTAHRAVGCAGYSRTDVILDDETENGPVFLEINTLPGLTAASFIPQQLEAAGETMKDFLASQTRLARAR